MRLQLLRLFSFLIICFVILPCVAAVRNSDLELSTNTATTSAASNPTVTTGFGLRNPIFTNSSASSSQPTASELPTQPCTRLALTQPSKQPIQFAPHNYGIKITKRVPGSHSFPNRYDYFSPIIHRGTRLPVIQTKNCTTFQDNQDSVDIQILQDNLHTQLNTFRLKGIPLMPRGRPVIVVIFQVNNEGVLHVSAKETITGKVAELSIVSSTLNTPANTQQQRLDRTYRDITPRVLATWFCEDNQDIALRQPTIAAFTNNQQIAALCTAINQLLFLQHQQPCFKRTVDGVLVTHQVKINRNFHDLVQQVVKQLRPDSVQTKLKQGLQQYHFRHIFHTLTPSIITYLRSQITALEEVQSSQEWVVTDYDPVSGRYEPLVRQRSSTTSSFTPTSFIQLDVEERLQPNYWWERSGHSAISAAAKNNVVIITQCFNKICDVNKPLYANKNDYKRDRRTLQDTIENHLDFDEVREVRRGGGGDDNLVTKLAELTGLMREIVSDFKTQQLRFLTVVKTITEEFA